ncbi:hypothetical protein [Janthinobacterium sp. LB3P118]|uniref:hypothetical protein n=1 Tax=Janthinobacterium sp. LB3P118 TaxID=3424195 RepID=UPI003F29EA49
MAALQASKPSRMAVNQRRKIVMRYPFQWHIQNIAIISISEQIPNRAVDEQLFRAASGWTLAPIPPSKFFPHDAFSQSRQSGMNAACQTIAANLAEII